ncbi:MAG: ricin-type beta-trefoil lectin domain protein [Chloroflexi bacterium]|nr:ricin-type beta-trefoil lectin domain protein [Chloroflexota bacterium]
MAESEQVSEQGVFLRVIAPLDEARGYCLDIPGHMSGVRIESPLQMHTCKHGIWNQDGRFDVVALGNGVLRMPHYQLCLQAENTSIGARLLLAGCTEAELQTWTLQDSGEIALEAFPQMCITVEEGPGRDAGGPQYLMKGVGLDTCAQQASDRQRWTTVIPR